MKTAIITGVLGQTGSYLAELLLEDGIQVYGVYRRVSTGNNFDNLQAVLNNKNLVLVEGDICDPVFMRDLIEKIKPDQFYNMAAISHVGHSFQIPIETFRVNAEAVISQLSIIQNCSPKTRYYQASTSELLGGLHPVPENGYTEDSPLNPRSPYAISKAAAHFAVRNARAQGLHASAGILHNHESPRRGGDFVTAKICKSCVKIRLGLQKTIKMGALDPCRDIGHARDYAKAIKLIVENDEPGEYIVATGQTMSVGEMLNYVCELAGLNPKNVYELDKSFLRPTEVPYLLGNASKIRKLGWKPEKTAQDILGEMYQHYLSLAGSKL